MKRNIIILIYTVLALGLSNPARGQSYACTNPYDQAPGSTPQQQALNTYWHYRYRLTHYFEVLGSKCGMSIPADIRNGTHAESDNGYIGWYDGGRELGWYLMMLATEYRLLADYGQNTDETVKELYYAIHAAYRLDSIFMDNWIRNYSIDPTFATRLHPSNYITFPGIGIFQDNDVNILYPGIIQLSDPLNAGIQTPIPPIGPPTNDYSTIPANLAWGEPPCASGTGQVGYVTLAAAEGLTQAIQSKDNYASLLMGLAMVVKLVDPSISGFPGCPDPYQYSSNLSITGPNAMAYQLGRALLHYLTAYPLDFNQTLPNGNRNAYLSSGWLEPYDEPMIIFGNHFFNLGYPNFGPDGGSIWNATTTCTAFLDGGTANAEQPIEWCAMSNTPH
jgi:hypothetical protein